MWLMLVQVCNCADEKNASIAKCSPDTALRDITELMERGILRKTSAGGRSTAYELAPDTTASD